MNEDVVQRDPLTEAIIGAAIEVHRALGPGLLESCYEQCLCFELSQRGLNFVRQHDIPVMYKDVQMDCGFRADIIVEGGVIVEIKSCEILHPIFDAQVLTYMKLAKIHRGLLLNFNVKLLKDGLRRFVI